MPDLVPRFSRRLTRLRREGVGVTARRALDVAALSLLRRIYGFDPWHAHSPLSARPYRRCLADMINRLSPDSVAEVGCGLGTMLPLVRARRRLGIDLDPRVIRAARRLRGKHIEFRVGSFEALPDEPVDVLVAVNWMHDIDAETLATMLLPALKRARYLVIDRISADTPLNYPHRHDYDFLAPHVAELASDDCGEHHRRFHLYRIRT